MSLKRLCLWGFLLLALAFYVLPIYVMVANGIKSADNVSLATMWQLPPPLVPAASPMRGGCFLPTCETASPW